MFILAALIFNGVAGLFAAPLDGGFALAPRPSASPAERAAAFREARSKVLSAAGKYENTPYRYGGIDQKGLDCSGLIYLSFHDALGVSPPRSTSGLYAWVEKIPNTQLQPGDLVFFKTDNTGKISHAGIFVEGSRFIHAASQGPRIGVIYSGLDEEYWASRYVGAGRALPKGDIAGENPDPLPAIPKAVTSAADVDRSNASRSNVSEGSATAVRPTAVDFSGGRPKTSAEADSAWVPVRPDSSAPVDDAVPAGQSAEKSGRFLLGVAVAPSLGGLLEDGLLEGGSIFRGFASQLRGAAQVHFMGATSLFGVELRPEYDGALGVFRLPITLSWGFDDRFRVFAGPAISFGDATLTTSDGERRYSGGTSVIGTIGVTAAPFIFQVGGGELAPYGELAWQSYFSDNSNPNLVADFAAGIRFSAGIRFTWKVR
jgi:probable lipoprotein NlpC